VPLYRSAGARAVEFIPTPYPVEDEHWDFARPLEERRGIFIGTREFDTPSRNHLAAILAIKQIAEALLEPVTVFNGDGWRGRRLLDRLGFADGLLRVIEKRLPYPRYLRLLAKHKIVWQLDASAVPGQVAGDALLVSACPALVATAPPSGWFSRSCAVTDAAPSNSSISRRACSNIRTIARTSSSAPWPSPATACPLRSSRGNSANCSPGISGESFSPASFPGWLAGAAFLLVAGLFTRATGLRDSIADSP
jgi:hypothetical protein